METKASRNVKLTCLEQKEKYAKEFGVDVEDIPNTEDEVERVGFLSQESE